MPGVIEVVWCPHPLRPASDRQLRQLLATGTDTADSVVRRLGLHVTSVQVCVNGAQVPRRRWRKRRVRPGDLIEVRQIAEGIGEWLGMQAAGWLAGAGTGKTIGTAAFISTVVSYSVNIVIGMALSMLAGSLTRKASGGSAVDDSPTTYAISGGSNGARPYAPLPLVLGEHRIFPDYASRPFAEMVLDPTTTRTVVNNDPRKEERTMPAWGVVAGIPVVPWMLIRSDIHAYYGDNGAREYDTTQGPQSMPHTFVVQYAAGDGESSASTLYALYEDYQSWGGNPDVSPFKPLPSGPVEVIVGYGYEVTYHSERVAQIFNFGFGDLDIDTMRLGTVSLDLYNSVQVDRSHVPAGQPDRTVIDGYSSDGWPGTQYPGNVQTVEGGKLEQHQNVERDGWIEREFSQLGQHIQVDLVGRLFRQGGGGFENLSCDFEAEFQPDGSGTWAPMPYSPMRLTNGSSTVVRRTFTARLDMDVRKIRVRRSSTESESANDIAEFECSSIKVFGGQDALYPAQNRLGLLIRATGQLNGTVETFSALVRARHWVWASSAPWTNGAYPAVGAGHWEWRHTVNPAWLFLYYARGGFLHTATASAHLGAAGWLDEPHPDNGQRLFGGGVPNARIDYVTIVAWAQFCDRAGLECRKVVTDSKSVGSVLDEIAAAGRATKTWAPGKLSVVWEEAGQPDLAAFGMANILAGTFSVQYLTDDDVDEYALEYSRSDADYEADTVYATVPGVALPVNQRTETANYSMPRAQAQRLVNLLAASRHYHRRTLTWESNLFGLNVHRGDIVRLAHDLTRWAYSGRLTGLTIQGGKVTTAHLAAEVENPDQAGEFWLWICTPGGDYMSVECQPPTGRTRQLQVLSDWQSKDAPGWPSADASDYNTASLWPDSVPEDWTWLAGPTPTPGKRVRIISTEPSGRGRLRIAARDEYEAYYPMEWSLDNPGEAPSGERLAARAFNLAALPADTGALRLVWELEAATGADVRVSINGGPWSQVPISGYLTTPGTELLLPAYPPGTELRIAILPVAAGTPVGIEGDSLEIRT